MSETAARAALRDAGWGLVAGIALGFLGWGEGRVPVLALALPLLIVFSRSRLQAFSVAAGYVLGMLRYSPSFVASWFDNNLAVGIAVVLAFALITGAVWSIGWSGSRRLHVRVVAFAAAWLLALVLNIGVPGHPLIAIGYVLPGWGWAGVAVAIAFPGLALGLSHLLRGQRSRRAAAGALIATLSLAEIALYQPPSNGLARGIQAERTHWGMLKGEDDALTRMQRMGAAKKDQLAAAIVWPESIVGRYDPAMYQVLDLEVLRESRRAGRIQIIGMDIPMQGNQLLNAAVAFYPDGRTATAVARQPAPLSLWRPWRSTNTFVADWTAHNILNVGQGDRAAVIFCYEEYMPVLYLLNEALDAPTIYLAVTNTWAAQAPGAAAIQTWHSLGMARLFGRPYVKAENRPAA